MPRKHLTKSQREEIVDLVEKGNSVRGVARSLKLCPSIVQRLMKKYKETGSTNNRPKSGRPRIKHIEDGSWFLSEDEERPFVCTACGKKFKKIHHVMSHMKIHGARLDFQCDQCGQGFVTKMSFQRHQRVHTGEKPFVCEYCGRGFADNGTMKTHIRTHTGERPHRCHLCDHACSTAGNLHHHMKVHRDHNGVIPRPLVQPPIYKTVPVLEETKLQEARDKIFCQKIMNFQLSTEVTDSNSGKQESEMDISNTINQHLDDHDGDTNRDADEDSASDEDFDEVCEDEVDLVPDEETNLHTNIKSAKPLQTNQRAYPSSDEDTVDYDRAKEGSVEHNISIENKEKVLTNFGEDQTDFEQQATSGRTNVQGSDLEAIVKALKHNKESEFDESKPGGKRLHLSKEKREEIVEMYKKGNSIRAVARNLNVNLSTVQRLIKKYKETGSTKNRPRSGRPKIKHVDNGSWFVSEDEERPFVCTECGKKFKNIHHVMRHMKIHGDRLDYQCDQCGQGFITMSSFQRHQRTHTGEKPFVCEYCGRGFADNGTMKTHIRTHTGERPHRCHLCDHACSTAGNLHHHMKVHRDHNGVIPLPLVQPPIYKTVPVYEGGKQLEEARNKLLSWKYPSPIKSNSLSGMDTQTDMSNFVPRFDIAEQHENRNRVSNDAFTKQLSTTRNDESVAMVSHKGQHKSNYEVLIKNESETDVSLRVDKMLHAEKDEMSDEERDSNDKYDPSDDDSPVNDLDESEENTNKPDIFDITSLCDDDQDCSEDEELMTNEEIKTELESEKSWNYV